MSKVRLIPALALVMTVCAAGPPVPAAAGDSAAASEPGVRIIRARVQPHPGAEVAEVDMKVHLSPTGLASVPAGEARLQDDDLVLGVVIDGRPMAYPIRYLAMYEIVDDRVGETPVAPSW